MKTLLAFLVPLLWAVPFLIGLVTQIKEHLPKTVPGYVIYLVAMLVGVAFTEAMSYLTAIDGGATTRQAVVLMTGLLLGGTSSGAFDIVKLLSAIGTNETTYKY